MVVFGYRAEIEKQKLTNPYKIYNIGNSSPVPLMENIAAIEKMLGKAAQKNHTYSKSGYLIVFLYHGNK